jgi:hypothetical protein
MKSKAPNMHHGEKTWVDLSDEGLHHERKKAAIEEALKYLKECDEFILVFKDKDGTQGRNFVSVASIPDLLTWLQNFEILLMQHGLEGLKHT